MFIQNLQKYDLFLRNLNEKNTLVNKKMPILENNIKKEEKSIEIKKDDIKKEEKSIEIKKDDIKKTEKK